MVRASRWGQTWRWALIGAVGLTLAAVPLAGQAQAPALALEQSLEPANIVVRGEGETDTASVTLTIRAPEAEGPALDLILALDRSASVNLDQMQQAAHKVVDHLAADDRVGVVAFGNRARVAQDLTGDRTSAREAIDGLQADRLTALGDGLRLALDELSDHGRSDAQPLVLLLTDGVSLTGRAVVPEAERAANNDVPVMAVGVADALRTRLLDGLARRADGAFYERFSPDVLEAIFRRVDRPAVARSLQLRDTVAGGLRYEGANGDSPSVLPGAAATRLEWSAAVMFAGEVWTTTYRLSGDAPGTYRLHGRPSGLTYRDTSGQERRVGFPERLALTVESP